LTIKVVNGGDIEEAKPKRGDLDANDEPVARVPQDPQGHEM
jgi:hypothetical protein